METSGAFLKILLAVWDDVGTTEAASIFKTKDALTTSLSSSVVILARY
jgi:hypothetical protein